MEYDIRYCAEATCRFFYNGECTNPTFDEEDIIPCGVEEVCH